MVKAIAVVHLSDVQTLEDEARRLEAAGYGALHTVELNTDPFLAHVILARATSSVSLGTSVAAAFGRSPCTTAHIAWELQQLSDGRFELGIGSQVRRHAEDRLSVPWAPPGPRMRDYVSCLGAIFDAWQAGNVPDYEGRFYRCKRPASMGEPEPLDRDPPKILISALNDYMIKMAGETCDGILIHPLSTHKYVTEFVLPRLRAGAKRGGRSLDNFIVSGGGFLGIGRDELELREAREAIRSFIGFIASTGPYKVILEQHGFGEVADRLHRMSVERRWDELAGQVPDELVDAVGIISDPAGVGEAIAQRWGGIYDRFFFLIMHQPAEPMTADELSHMIGELDAAGMHRREPCRDEARVG